MSAWTRLRWVRSKGRTRSSSRMPQERQQSQQIGVRPGHAGYMCCHSPRVNVDSACATGNSAGSCTGVLGRDESECAGVWIWIRVAAAMQKSEAREGVASVRRVVKSSLGKCCNRVNVQVFLSARLKCCPVIYLESVAKESMSKCFKVTSVKKCCQVIILEVLQKSQCSSAVYFYLIFEYKKI